MPNPSPPANERLDPQVWARERIGQTSPALSWTPGTLPAMRAWQRRLRSRLRTLTGIPAPTPAPVRATIVAEHDFGPYRREAVQFESRAGLDAFGYFLIPTDAPPHGPVILCLPGHGRGVDSIVGIGEDGSQRGLGEPDEYAADFALQCVGNGYAALAMEQMSFGRRRDAQAVREADSSSCRRDSMAALMMGETIMGWRVGDAMRALDYLAGRPEVDPGRMAVMGISGGGATAFWAACLDTRVRCAVVSGYFNTFRDSILAVDHCVDNFVPGLLRVTEMPDMAGLITPRALFVENGQSDSIFPVTGFGRAVTRAEEIYAAFNAGEQFGAHVFDGGHEFHGVRAFPFLKSRL